MFALPMPFPHGAPKPGHPWPWVVLLTALAHAALLWSLGPGHVPSPPEPLPADVGVAVTWIPLSPPAARAEAMPPRQQPIPTPARTNAPALVNAPPPVEWPLAAASPSLPTPTLNASLNANPVAPAPAAATTASHAAPNTAAPSALTSPPDAPIARPAPAAAPRPDATPSFDAAYLDNPRPAYPSVSRIEGEQGTVILRVHVLATGLADRVEIHTSSGHDRLDKAARSAVARWRFVPARSGDQAVAAWVQVPIVYSLQKAQP
jgi:protein TonB